MSANAIRFLLRGPQTPETTRKGEIEIEIEGQKNLVDNRKGSGKYGWPEPVTNKNDWTGIKWIKLKWYLN